MTRYWLGWKLTLDWKLFVFFSVHTKTSWWIWTHPHMRKVKHETTKVIEKNNSYCYVYCCIIVHRQQNRCQEGTRWRCTTQAIANSELLWKLGFLRSFHSYANKTDFHGASFGLNLAFVVVVKATRNWEWPIRIRRSIITDLGVKMVTTNNQKSQDLYLLHKFCQDPLGEVWIRHFRSFLDLCHLLVLALSELVFLLILYSAPTSEVIKLAEVYFNHASWQLNQEDGQLAIADVTFTNFRYSLLVCKIYLLREKIVWCILLQSVSETLESETKRLMSSHTWSCSWVKGLVNKGLQTMSYLRWT